MEGEVRDAPRRYPEIKFKTIIASGNVRRPNNKIIKMIPSSNAPMWTRSDCQLVQIHEWQTLFKTRFPFKTKYPLIYKNLYGKP